MKHITTSLLLFLSIGVFGQSENNPFLKKLSLSAHVGYGIHERLAFQLEGMYDLTEKLEFVGLASTDFSNYHSLGLGLRYRLLNRKNFSWHSGILYEGHLKEHLGLIPNEKTTSLSFSNDFRFRLTNHLRLSVEYNATLWNSHFETLHNSKLNIGINYKF